MSSSLTHWESYYRQGALTVCPVGPSPNYSAEVRAAWENFFLTLSSGATIVDVGTGNGAIALIAKETAGAAGKTFAIHGIDRAQIHPERDVPHGYALFEGIRFLAGVSAETMPFADRSVDAVCGQYALEYMQLERALAEIARVLAAGGQAQFIMHSQESVLFQNAQESLRLARVMFGQIDIMNRCRGVIGVERYGLARAEAARARLTAGFQELDRLIRSSPNPHLAQQVHEMLRNFLVRQPAFDEQAALAGLARMDRDVQDALKRVRDLAQYALSRNDIDRLRRRVTRAGFADFRAEQQVHADRHIVGWRVTFRSSEPSA